MREIIKLVFILTFICAVCVALLAGVNSVTQAPIAVSKTEKENAAVRKVLPADAPAPEKRTVGEAVHFVSLDAYGNLVAAAVKGRSANGYGGDITLMVGFAADGTLLNFAVLEAQETPGLGSKIDSPGFRAGICGRPAGTKWFVKKDAGEVDAITAATISSRAALEAIRDAVTQFNTLKESPGATATP
jgi:electron transport complex protein RnfG